MNNAWLIAPSAKINVDKLNLALKRVKKLGFSPKYRKDILDKDLYFAGSLDRRVSEFTEALLSEKADVIFCVRGGYASMEILSKLDWKKIKNSKKTIIGYSDISALLLGLYSKGFKGNLIHGPLQGIKFWCFDKNNREIFKKAINGEPYSLSLPERAKIVNSRDFQGRIIGGNFRIFAHMTATDYEVQTKDKILFLEDVNERPAAIYNMLLHLELSGKLKNIKALLLGKMNKCGKCLPFIEKFVSRLKIPVIYQLNLGHENNIIPIRLGDLVSFNSKTNELHFKK